MTRIIPVLVGLVVLAGVVAPAPAAAQGLSFNIGGFIVRSEDSRTSGDVLVEDLNYHYFDLSGFNSFTFGGEWWYGLTRHFEAVTGVQYYQDSVPAVYRDWVNENDTEIPQTFKLRNIPISAGVRIFPFAREGAFQPYVGAGLGIFVWRYSEFGEFIDPDTGDIYRATYASDGVDLGPILYGGVRVPVGGHVAVGGEVRYQNAVGTLSTDFLSDKIDLGGWNYLFKIDVRY